MTDTPAVNSNRTDSEKEHDKTVGETVDIPASSRYTKLARAISNILSPSVISVPMVFLVAFYQARSVQSALVYAVIALFFLSIGPLLYILIGVALGKLSDIDVSRRTERFGPFFFSLISVCAGCFVLVVTRCPSPLISVMLTVAVSGVVMLTITFWWKISIHASSLAGAATLLTLFYGAGMLPLFLLVVLVSWSRVVLHRHTIAQVVAGSLLSIVLTVVVLKLRGL